MESSNLTIAPGSVKEIIITYAGAHSLEGLEMRLYGAINPEMFDAINGPMLNSGIKVNSRNIIESKLPGETINIASAKVTQGFAAIVQIRKMQLDDSTFLTIGSITVYNSFGNNKLLYVEGLQKIFPQY